jgi:MFS family permease
MAPTLPVAMVGVLVGSLGNGIAVVCNALLVQRGAPDALRGRVFTVIMSSNYTAFGLGMVAAGPLVDEFGARWLWAGASVAFVVGAVTAAVLTRGVDASAAAAELELEVPATSTGLMRS